MIFRTAPKTALFREVSAKFDFIYQTAGIHSGSYVCEEPEADVMDIVVNSAYLVDNLSISGSIPEAVFVSSLLPEDLISFQLVHYRGGELITARRYSISQYYQEKQISSHCVCNRSNDGIRMRIFNRLLQVPETIGIDTIAINCSIGTYQIDGKEFNAYIRGREDVH